MLYASAAFWMYMYNCVNVQLLCLLSLYSFLICWIMKIVLKRCISGLPKSGCPFIPKAYFQNTQTRYQRNIDSNDTISQFDRAKRSPIQFPDSLTPLSQTAVTEPPSICEQRRQVGTQILYEKGNNADSMLSRFVGNFIMIFSNQTTSQEVSKCFVCQWISTFSTWSGFLLLTLILP